MRRYTNRCNVRSPIFDEIRHESEVSRRSHRESVILRGPLKQDGTWMIVEPMAGNSLEENLNPVGRLYYAGSTMICLPTSLSQEVGAALGAQAGEAKLREVITSGGFKTVRRATETPFNMILEARL
jgi:hypothetical protein